MAYIQLLRGLGPQKFGPEIESFALKAARTFTDIVQGNQSNKARQEIVRMNTTRFRKTIEAAPLATKQSICTSSYIEQMIDQRMKSGPPISGFDRLVFAQNENSGDFICQFYSLDTGRGAKRIKKPV